MVWESRSKLRDPEGYRDRHKSYKIKNPERLSSGFKCGVGVPSAREHPRQKMYKIKNPERLSSGF